MVYVIMEFLTGIMGGGLAGVFYNSDEKNVSRIREAIVLTGSDFLMNKFEEGLLLFKTIEDENSEDEDEEYSETAEQVDQIGEDIDNWDWDELKTTYIALGK